MARQLALLEYEREETVGFRPGATTPGKWIVWTFVGFFVLLTLIIDCYLLTAY